MADPAKDSKTKTPQEAELFLRAKTNQQQKAQPSRPAPSSTDEPVYETEGNEPSDTRGKPESTTKSGDDESKTPGNKNLADVEKKAGDKSTNKDSAAEPEQKKLGVGGPDDRAGSGYRKTKTTEPAEPTKIALNPKSWLRRNRKKLFGGGLVGFIAGLVLMFSVASGPLQIIHFAQLLQKFHLSNNENFSDGRSIRTIIYTMTGRANQTRLGKITNPLANKWEARLVSETGLRPIYTKGLPNRFAGFEVVDDTKARGLLDDFDRDGIDTNARPTLDNPLVNKDGKNISRSTRIVSATGEQFRTKRSMIRTVGSGTSTTKVASVLGSRLLIKRGGVDFRPLGIKRAIGDSIATYYRKAKDQRATADRSGVNSKVPEFRSNVDEDGNGTPDGDAADRAAADAANDMARQAAEADLEGTEGSKALKSLKAGLSKSAGPVVVIGALCTVKSFGKDVEVAQYRNIVLPMMRMGWRIISTGDNIKHGKNVNLEELGSIVSDFKDPDTNTSWQQARSIQAELGQPPTGPDIAPEAKPSRVGEKPAMFSAVDEIPLLDDTCGVASAIFGLPVIRHVSAWTSGALIGTANKILNLKGYSVEGMINSAINMAAGRAVDPYAQGADLGNLANYGARLAANDQALSTGGRALNGSEIAILDAQQAENEKYEAGKRSIAQRLFDPYSADSAVARLIDSAPTSGSQIRAGLASFPKTFLGSIARLSNVFSPKISAAQTYNYGFDEYGFSAAEQADARFEDPFENADWVEPRLEELNDKYGNCFSMRISPNDTLDSGEAVNYADLAKNNNCNDDKVASPANCTGQCEDLLRYRFYLADMVTAHSLACYEGYDQSCDNLGFDSSDQTDTTVPTTTAGEQIVGDVGEDSDSIACAPGTTNLGTVNNTYKGPLKKSPAAYVKLRICRVDNMPGDGDDKKGDNTGFTVVNSRVSGAVFAMAAAAKAAGVPFVSTSSFRTTQGCTGDSDSCAKQGYSYHQLGIAIDFADIYRERDGRADKTCLSNDPVATRQKSELQSWKWLHLNSTNFGFKQYCAEAWHWDASNDGSRVP